ncbi:MAG TPA: putative Ig domain-containing protein [Thermoanaerobaculia bacterium]|jgi:hypothetical protein|nr:putative Ig domain-containing protein [Thermoanaerobaculia bacterium]
MHFQTSRWQTWKALGAAVLLAALAAPASAQIIQAGAGGHIDFRSGFPPLNAPPGFVTTGIVPIPIGPAGGIFLQRFHLAPQGYAEGGTGVRVLTAPLGYFFHVPTTSYLLQRRNAPCAPADLPAELFTHFDAVFQLGPGGFPGHIARLAYPVVGRNAPGPGSYSVFFARLTFGARPFPGAGIVNLGQAWIGYFDFRPGAFFFVIPTAAIALPPIPGGWQFLVWGDILFRTRGCPLFFAGAEGLQISGAASGDDGQIGVQDEGELPPHDPSITEIPFEEIQDVLMDMPLPDLPTEGFDVTVMEVSEDHDGNINHRPQIDPLSEQLGAEDQTLSFTATASDPDGDPITWSLENAPAGMSIDAFGNVTWTPASGEAGTYEITVKASDDHGALAQTDEQVVTVIVEGSNHASDAFVTEGDTLTQLLSASDPDPSDTLTFTLAGPAPDGVSLSSDGVLTWATTGDQGPRDYVLSVRVTDDGSPSLWREGSFTVSVGAKPATKIEAPFGSGKLNRRRPQRLVRP